jgi:hypothetical protein
MLRCAAACCRSQELYYMLISWLSIFIPPYNFMNAALRLLIGVTVADSPWTGAVFPLT